MDSDKLVVVDAGKVMEFDTPTNLIAKEGLFSDLYQKMVENSQD